jgi:protein-disulfide isomerase
VIAVLVVAAIGVGALESSRHDGRLGLALALKARADREVGSLLGGIPQQGNALGRPTAPVTLQVFGDLECLTVKNWVITLLPAIIQQFVRPGLVQIQYRSFKTDTHNLEVFLNQQSAALAAGAQKKMWNFIETFYYEQGKEYTPYATEGYLDGIAGQVPGLSRARWHRDRENAGLAERVVADDQSIRALGFHDTPAFMIGRTGGLMKKLTGRHIVLQFPGYSRMRNPLSLIDALDLRKAIQALT